MKKVIQDYRSIYDVTSDVVTKDIVLQDISFLNGFGFAGPCEFLGQIIFSDCSFSMISSYVNFFKGEFILKNCEIKRDLVLHGQFMESVIIEKCQVGGKLEIVDSVFQEEVRIVKSTFKGGTNLIGNEASFGSVEFKKGLTFFN